MSGWRGDAPEGTSIVAPLVLKKKGEAVEARFSEGTVSASDFADNLAVVLPEFRRDFLEAVARNFGESVSIEAFLEACERAAGVPAVVEPEAAAAAPDVVATPVAADTADAAAPPAAAAATPAPEPAPESRAGDAAGRDAEAGLLSRMSSAFGSSRKKKAADAEEVAEDVEEEVVADEAVAAPAPA